MTGRRESEEIFKKGAGFIVPLLYLGTYIGEWVIILDYLRHELDWLVSISNLNTSFFNTFFISPLSGFARIICSVNGMMLLKYEVIRWI